MSLSADLRYELKELYSERAGRSCGRAWDCLSNRSVVLKTETTHSLLREMAVMLSLPTGIAPSLVDAIWSPAGELTLVLEHLTGRTLLQAAATLSEDELPELVHSVAQGLIHLHRSGFVHCDIKPSNLFLLESGRGVRLLDFGFTRYRTALFGPASSGAGVAETWQLAVDSNEDRGGTPPFIAPELARGWAVDGRADQYSLGVTLMELFPALQSDSRWEDLLTTLTMPSPTKRYADMLSFRDAVEERFDLPPHPERFPRLGGGPLRGRRDELATLGRQLNRARGRVCLLQRARPGTGLTRFMLECLMREVLHMATPLRLLDLSRWPSSWDDERISSLVASWAEETSILMGVADPSPTLAWQSSPAAPALTRSLETEANTLPLLRALDGEAFDDLTAESLGHSDMGSRQLATSLLGRSEGDLGIAAHDFAHFVEASAYEDGLDWRIGSDRLKACAATELAGDLWPRVGDLPPELLEATLLCAHAGRRADREVFQGLLIHFDRDKDLDALLHWGVLQPVGDGQVEFLTRHLRAEALAEGLARAADAKRWLHEHLRPNINDVEEIVESCRRARALEEPGCESDLLGKALEAAWGERRWHDLKVLLGYPGPPLELSDEERLYRQLDALPALLGADWPMVRVLRIAASGFMYISPQAAAPFLQKLADHPELDIAAEGLLWQVENALSSGQKKFYCNAMQRLETIADHVTAGVLDLQRAIFAQIQGRPAESESLALDALAALRDGDPRYRSICLQLLAILGFERSPVRALGLMRSAADQAPNQDDVARVHLNLSKMQKRLGDLPASLQSTEAGLAALEHRGMSRRVVRLRAQRAEILGYLDRIEEAWREAQQLLELPQIRSEQPQLITLLMLTGFCAMHRGEERRAIRDTARAWELCSDGVPRAMRVSVLMQLVDFLLVAKDWDLVREYAHSFSLDRDRTDPIARLTLIRVRALQAMAAGDVVHAVDILSVGEETAKAVKDPVLVSRFLYHLACAEMAAAGIAAEAHAFSLRAARHFSRSRELLGEGRFTYNQALCALGQARTSAVAGDWSAAWELSGEAQALAEAKGCRAVLAQVLRLRAELGLRRNEQS